MRFAFLYYLENIINFLTIVPRQSPQTRYYRNRNTVQNNMKTKSLEVNLLNRIKESIKINEIFTFAHGM